MLFFTDQLQNESIKEDDVETSAAKKVSLQSDALGNVHEQQAENTEQEGVKENDEEQRVPSAEVAQDVNLFDKPIAVENEISGNPPGDTASQIAKDVPKIEITSDSDDSSSSDGDESEGRRKQSEENTKSEETKIDQSDDEETPSAKTEQSGETSTQAREDEQLDETDGNFVARGEVGSTKPLHGYQEQKHEDVEMERRCEGLEKKVELMSQEKEEMKEQLNNDRNEIQVHVLYIVNSKNYSKLNAVKSHGYSPK